MKAVSFALTLVASFAPLARADERGDLGDAVRGFLDSTVNVAQDIGIPTPDQILNVVQCEEQTLTDSSCNMLGGLNGVKVCRNILGVDVTVCTPKVFDNYVGRPGTLILFVETKGLTDC